MKLSIHQADPISRIGQILGRPNMERLQPTVGRREGLEGPTMRPFETCSRTPKKILTIDWRNFLANLLGGETSRTIPLRVESHRTRFGPIGRVAP